MTNREEPSNSTPFYKLNYFQGEVGVKFMDRSKTKLEIKGQKIFPDVEYWEDAFGMQEVSELQDQFYQNNPKYLEFYSSYWVEKKLHDQVTLLCQEQQIDSIHVDNLCVPLSDFKRTNHSFHGHDVHDVAKEIIKLRNAVNLLEEQGLQITQLSIDLSKFDDIRVRSLANVKSPDERKHDIGFDPRYNEQSFKKITSTKVTSARALEPITSMIKSLLKKDNPLSTYLNRPYWDKWASTSAPKRFRSAKDRMAHIIYRYLLDHSIAKSPNDACGKMGLFVSLVDSKYGMTEEEFLKRQTEELAKYADRQAYFAEKFIKKMKSLDESEEILPK